MTNKSEQIRGAVVSMFAETGRRFRTRDVSNSAIGREFGGELISSALSNWARNEFIVDGHALRLHKEEGKQLQFSLEPVVDAKSSGINGVANTLQKAIDFKQRLEDTGTFVAHILQEKGTGAMLVRTPNGDLYEVKPLKW